jgi:N-acetylglucosaminyl-diphospho-decaprenol L-rhamnosyltransferase
MPAAEGCPYWQTGLFLPQLSSLPNVAVIPCSENVGYGRGNNIGMARACGKYILYLNPDTEVVDDAIITLYRFMESCPKVGVAGPYLCEQDGNPDLLPRTFPTLLGTVFEASLLVKHTPSSLLDRECLYAPPQGVVEVDWVLGAALMAPRKLIEEVGGFDEDFIIYSEEKDLCARIRARGYTICLIAEAKVIHLDIIGFKQS